MTVLRSGSGALALRSAAWLRAPLGGGFRFGSRVRGLESALVAVLGMLLVVPIAAFLLVALSPRLFSQGSQWFTLEPLRAAVSGSALRALGDSALVGAGAAFGAVALALPLALLVQRTTLLGRRVWQLGMWGLLLAPSYLVALGWERLFEPGGVLVRAGIDSSGPRGLLYGSAGVIGVLGIKGVPFAFLAISAALGGLGSSFEQAARVHGASRLQALRTVVPIIAPALWASLAIVFAESVSDFGVASTLAFDAHFPVATFGLFSAVNSTPVRFDLAAAIGWTLVALALLALLAQARSTRGRSYQVLSGRSRPYARHRLSVRAQLGALVCVGGFFVLALGVPVIGAVSASLLKDSGSAYGGLAFSLESYRHALSGGLLLDPLAFSARLAAIAASVVILLAVPTARLLGRRARGPLGRAVDLALLCAVALPTIVLAAGYILVYNLPLFQQLGLALYGTTTLLALGYLAGALPTAARLFVGPLAQLQDTLLQAARVHGARAGQSWTRVAIPVLSRTLLWGWLLCFSLTLFELPISQLLYPPSAFPLSVAIERELYTTYDFGGGTAMEVIAVLAALAFTAASLGLFRLLAPAGWRQVGQTA